MSDQIDRLSPCSGIEALPLELYRMVCEQLEPRVIAKLRLVSKKSSEVATPYFLSCVHLIFTTESFQKLYDIAQHVVINRHITSILYEADSLEKLNRREWSGRVYDSAYLNQISIRYQYHATDEDRRKLVVKHASFTGEQLDRAWGRYQVELQDQEVLRQRQCGIETLQASIAYLPKLKTFRMKILEGPNSRSQYLIQALGAGLPDASGRHLDHRSNGLPQLRAILLSMYHAGIELETFACGEVSWRIFDCSADDWTAFAAILSRVRNFKLRMSVGNYIDETGAEFRDCRRLMQSGRCADLLSQAYDHLRKLDIMLVSYTRQYLGLKLTDLVADRVWPRLSKVALSGLATTEDILIQFLEKHKATLRKLRLAGICLTTGEWPHALPRMRSTIQLDCCLLEGSLSSKVPERHFRLGRNSLKHAEDTENAPWCKNERTIAINDWFCKGGICPLTDEWSGL